MKISQYNTTTACNIPRKLSLRDPFTGELLKDDKGQTIDFHLYGLHSDIARNAVKERARKKTEQMDDEQAGAEFLAQLTMGWSANLEDDDGPIEFTFRNAAKLYIEQDWIARQVLGFINDVGNFNPRLYATPSGGSKKGRGSIASPSMEA
jgi:hypothetical protein